MKKRSRVLKSIIASMIFLIVCSCMGKPGSQSIPGTDRYNHGITLLERGDYKGAIEEFKAAIKADPGSFEAVKNLANAYVLDGKYQEARKQYAIAQSMRPDDPSIYTNLASVYQQLGEFDLAWGMLETAVQKNPLYPLAHYRAGELFLAQGRKEEAARAFRDYLRLEPNSIIADNALAVIQSINPDASIDLSAGIVDLKQSKSSEISTEGIQKVDQTQKEALKTESQNNDDKPATIEKKAEDQTSVKKEETSKPNEEADKKKEIEKKEARNEEARKVSEENDRVQEDEAAPADRSENKTVSEPEEKLPELTGDALYQDRLKRGRQLRILGSPSKAIPVLKEAYEVHPDYAVINYELALAYIANKQPCEGKEYLERYIKFETDPDAKAEAQKKLNALTCEESDE